MLTLFRKKKLTEDKVANIFVNTTIDVVEQGFAEVAGIINEDETFETSPAIALHDSDQFLLIVTAGNLAYLPKYFHNYQDLRLIDSINSKMAQAIGTDKPNMQKLIANYQSYMKKVNSPSKNTLYAMSKAVFYKYDLNKYQQEYFREKNTPNPIFLRIMNEALNYFLWDWEAFIDKYKITE